MKDKKTRSKHIGYSAQREQCRLNKFTYIEKINGAPVLFCNYPFEDISHKKGICKAGTCTDMREIPADILAADEGTPKPMTIVVEDDKVEVPGENTTGTTGEDVDGTTGEGVDGTKMPCPSNE